MAEIVTYQFDTSPTMLCKRIEGEDYVKYSDMAEYLRRIAGNVQAIQLEWAKALIHANNQLAAQSE